MKYFDEEFCEREDEPEKSQKAIDYYTGARNYFERQLAEVLAKNSQSAASQASLAADADADAADADDAQAAQLVEVRADLGRALGRLGEALRFAGRTAESLECKLRSLEIWELLGRSRAIYLARIRLAAVLDQCARSEEALQILRELRAALALPDAPEDLAVYADFIHEALALVLVRRGESAAARPELDAALKIRIERGQAQMIERTRDLLRRIGGEAPAR